jgi:hypothetical protein
MFVAYIEHVEYYPNAPDGVVWAERRLGPVNREQKRMMEKRGFS